MNELVFLKLGGSLITDKGQASTARPAVLARIAREIAQYMDAHPDARVLLGHGSGSFAHRPAQQYNTRAGVHGAEGWRGFVEVWAQAAALNRIVMDALRAAGLSAIGFPPSAGALATEGEIAGWDLQPLQAALQAGLLPVVYGDVAFDQERGGTILSTEDLFLYLAGKLEPGRVLLAGDEAGIYADYPARQKLLPRLERAQAAELGEALGGAKAADVTGGMAGKVGQMFSLLERVPEAEVRIFSGLEPDAIFQALSGEALGTLLQAV